MNFKLKKILVYIRQRLDAVYLFGSGISLYQFFEVLWKSIVRFDLDQRATSVAFSFLLAVFPGILFLFNLIPYIPIENLDTTILGFIQTLMPHELYEVIYQTIEEIINKPKLGILSFGFLFSIYAATNGVNSLARAFNMALEEKKNRSFVRARGVAAFVLFLLIFILMTAILLIISGKIILANLTELGIGNTRIMVLGIKLLGYLAIFFIFYFGIASLYYFAPALTKRIKFFNFGAVFASVLSILATNLFTIYFENFSRYNKLYGSIGTLIAIMLWMYLLSLIVILGFEMNVNLRAAKWENEEETILKNKV